MAAVSIRSDFRVVSSAYLRLFVFLSAVLIPPCDSSSLAYCLRYSAYRLNKQGDNIQPCCIPFPVLNLSVVPCLFCYFLACIQASHEIGKVVWYSCLFKNFSKIVGIHAVKSFSIISEAEVDVFLEFRCFLGSPACVGNLISGSSAFSKFSLGLIFADC